MLFVRKAVEGKVQQSLFGHEYSYSFIQACITSLNEHTAELLTYNHNRPIHIPRTWSKPFFPLDVPSELP